MSNDKYFAKIEGKLNVCSRPSILGQWYFKLTKLYCLRYDNSLLLYGIKYVLKTSIPYSTCSCKFKLAVLKMVQHGKYSLRIGNTKKCL